MLSWLRKIVPSTAAQTTGESTASKELGDAHLKRNELDDAARCYKRALLINPAYAEAELNLGFVLREQENFQEAEQHLTQALALNPDLADAYYILGTISNEKEDLHGAIRNFSKALEINPEFEAVYPDLFLALFKSAQMEDANIGITPISIKPDYVDAYLSLGNAFLRQGAPEQALVCFRHVVRLEPENSATHLIAALTGENPDRASSQYIEQLFDQFAEKFDSHMVQTLSYSVPEHLVALICKFSDRPAEKWNILDLGCGTGLMGSAIAPYAEHLVGVDLSAKMLAKSKARNLYHRLEQSDLLAMMQDESASSYDVVVAADVFIYLGKLDDLAGQVHRLLRPGGIFAFSVESLEPLICDDSGQSIPGDYRLNHTGRYAHSATYLRRIAADNRFDVTDIVSARGRLDRDEPVQVHLALWCRSSEGAHVD